MVLASYGSVPSSIARKPMRRGTVMVALFSLGVVALASVVIMLHSGVSVVDLTKVSDKQANIVSSDFPQPTAMPIIKNVKCLTMCLISGDGFLFPWYAARYSEDCSPPTVPFF